MNSSVIDLPRKKNEADLFGIQKYQNALVEFIKNSQTPLTIALQGEWGSGKTSLMNMLDDELCSDKKPFYRVWINSWQYSLMKTPEESILKIVEGMIEQILMALSDNDGKSEVIDKMKSVFIKIALSGGKFLAKQLVEKAGGNAEYVEDLFKGKGSDGAEISQMKKEIEDLIKKVLEKSKDNFNKIGFIFFIDDLDRIDPPVAVQILELLKNIFDLDKCIFVLAIDYDVVIKGLEPKFGKLTEKNEREFRSFFDKIIQMPFSMPVSAYTIDKFLIDALKNIGFIDEKEANDTDLNELFTDFASLSVGQNPRALKRLTNTLSLINIINKSEKEKDSDIENEKLIGFAMVCLQIAYPLVYNKLIEDPNFTNWGEHTAIKLDLDPLTETQKEKFNKTEEFNDPWEKVVFQMCQKETYSKNRVFQISTLLNKVKGLIPEEQNLGAVLESILEQSAITNLVAFDKPKVIELSKKESIIKLQKFAEQLYKEFLGNEILKNDLEIFSKKLISWDGFLKLSIPIANKKFSEFQFTFQVIQVKGDNIFTALRAWKGENNKYAQDHIFDKVWQDFTNKGLPANRTLRALSWKYYPINFSQLDQNMIEMLADESKTKELINHIVTESEMFIRILKETLEADI